MYDAILSAVARHIQLTPNETQIFQSVLVHRKFRKRQYVVQAGDVCRYENFVVKGVLRAYSVNAEGKEHIVMFAMEGWWISDLYSFLTSTPATLNIDVLEDCDILSIEKPALVKLYEQVPKFDRLFRVLLQNAFIAQQQRILGTISQTVEERYEEFIRKYPLLEQRIPQHQVASFIGTTPETLSRIRKQAAKA